MASSSYYNNNKNLKELERITSSVNDALLPSGFIEEEENNNNHVVCGVMSIITFIWLVIFCVTGVGLGLCYEFLEIHSLHHAPGAASDTFFLCLIGYWSQALVGFLFAASAIATESWLRSWKAPPIR